MIANRFVLTAPLLLLVGLAGAGCNADTDVQRGLAFVTENCARCHAVGTRGDSPHPDARPFRTLHEMYPVEFLAEALAEGITVGHSDMPQFVLSPRQINDVLAYLRTLEVPR